MHRCIWYSVIGDIYVMSVIPSSFQDKFFLLELKNGFLRLMYDFGFSSGPILMESNVPKLQINDARYHEVNLFPLIVLAEPFQQLL